MYEVGETCELGEQFFEEETLDNYMSHRVNQQLRQQGFEQYTYPSTPEEREAAHKPGRSLDKPFELLPSIVKGGGMYCVR